MSTNKKQNSGENVEKIHNISTCGLYELYALVEQSMVDRWQSKHDNDCGVRGLINRLIEE